MNMATPQCVNDSLEHFDRMSHFFSYAFRFFSTVKSDLSHCLWSKFVVQCIVDLLSLCYRIAFALNQNMELLSIGMFEDDQMRKHRFGSNPAQLFQFPTLLLLCQSDLPQSCKLQCSYSTICMNLLCCMNPDRLQLMFEVALTVSDQPLSWKCFDSYVWLTLSLHSHLCYWFVNCFPFEYHLPWFGYSSLIVVTLQRW
jgi:hypothetical protein